MTGPVTKAIAAIRGDEAPVRRSFLRGLLTLPLIGGGVTLIGSPSAVAEPVSDVLLREYFDWLTYERTILAQEITGTECGQPKRAPGSSLRWAQRHMPDGPVPLLPSTRAALVLSAVGVDWRV